jgi:predicted helicase
VLAFITNRSFIDSRTFDGFRKIVAKDFNEIWLVDLKGNARTSGERRRQEGGNIFDDQIRVGVAVSFFVRKKGATGCRIRYTCVRDYAKSDEKREFLAARPLRDHDFDEVRPDAKGNWLNLTHNDFDSLIPLASKETKNAKTPAKERAIFKLFSLGVVTNRDDWVYAPSDKELLDRVAYLIDVYESRRATSHGRAFGEDHGVEIKWTRAVKNDLARGIPYRLDLHAISESYYRPFVKRRLYFSRQLNEMVYQVPQLFGRDAGTNRAFGFVAEDRAKFSVIAFDAVPNKDLFMPSAAQVLAQFRYENGQRLDNITGWALKQFASHYKAGTGKRLPEPTREGIFHYVYAVLHDPAYREKYAQNLKREFPRIPLYGATRADFWQWADWGRELMDLHIGFESVEPWPLHRTDIPDEKARAAGQRPKCVLKAQPDAGRILVDSETTLTGIPPEAFAYRLGNRSALDWVLDQHKEKKPKDPTIREKFDTYRFADHKERVIDLLARVTRVSVETQRITAAMKTAPR